MASHPYRPLPLHNLKPERSMKDDRRNRALRTKPIVPAPQVVVNPSARVWPWVTGGALLLFAGATWIRAKQRRNALRAQG